MTASIIKPFDSKTYRKWLTKFTPYLLDPLDDLADPEVQLVFSKGASMGKSEIILSTIKPKETQ